MQLELEVDRLRNELEAATFGGEDSGSQRGAKAAGAAAPSGAAKKTE